MDREREYQNKNDCQNGNNEEKTKTTEKMDYLGWSGSEVNGNKKLASSDQRLGGMEVGFVRSQGPRRTLVLEEDEGRKGKEKEVEENKKKKELIAA